MSKIKADRFLQGISRCNTRISASSTSLYLNARAFHTTSPLQTDGVFRALTEARITVPWIDAFNKIKNGEKPPNAKEESIEPRKQNLTPKKMSDSYHRVVCACNTDFMVGTVAEAYARFSPWHKINGCRILT